MRPTVNGAFFLIRAHDDAVVRHIRISPTLGQLDATMTSIVEVSCHLPWMKATSLCAFGLDEDEE